MRVAGVRLPNGGAVWVDAGSLEAAPLDVAVVQIGGTQAEGEVFVAPGQLLAGAQAVDGVLLSAHRPMVPDAGCQELPGADLPALGTEMSRGDTSGVVTAVDAVNRTVTITSADGREITEPADTAPAPRE